MVGGCRTFARTLSRPIDTFQSFSKSSFLFFLPLLQAADVIYFALTRVIAAGASLNDIERILDQRSLKVTRRPGNAKEYRTKAAEEILNKGKGKD
jgi:hypothetical protein